MTERKRTKKGSVSKVTFTVMAAVALLSVAVTTTTTRGAVVIPAFAQTPNQVCADAAFTPPLPKSFTNGTSIPFTVDFGISFSTVTGVAAISTYDPADAFGNGDRYFIDNYGGQQTQPGTPEITTMTLNSVDPGVLNQFLNGHFRGSYIDEAGMFTLTSLKFCVRGEPLQQGVCPSEDVQHWDKIVFMITSPDIARQLNLTANTELDVKVLDDPHKVSDVKQKVLDFLKIPTAPKTAIRIISVDYAIICTPPSATTTATKTSVAAKL